MCRRFCLRTQRWSEYRRPPGVVLRTLYCPVGRRNQYNNLPAMLKHCCRGVISAVLLLESRLNNAKIRPISAHCGEFDIDIALLWITSFRGSCLISVHTRNLLVQVQVCPTLDPQYLHLTELNIVNTASVAYSHPAGSCNTTTPLVI